MKSHPYGTRLRRLRSLSKSAPILVTDKSDIFYFTGLEVEGVWLLAVKKGLFAFCPRLLAEQVRLAVPAARVTASDKMADSLTEQCRKAGIRAIAADWSGIGHALFCKIDTKIKIKHNINISSLTRVVKDRAELNIIEKSCKIANSAFRYARSIAKPGRTEKEIALKIEEYFIKKGARACFLPIVASGPNTALPHHTSSSRKIRKNDIVLIDLGCSYSGYCSDLTRTFFLSKMNELQRTVFSLVDKAQKLAIKQVRPGKKAGEVDRSARDLISAAGFGRFFIHSTGHGVGIEVHEAPAVNAASGTALEPGMVITVEPGIYIPGKFGVRIEDTVQITMKGARVLTK